MSENKWDDIILWVFVLDQYKNATGATNTRPHRTRTTTQHKKFHMDVLEMWFKRRESIAKHFLSFKCESYDKANARYDIITAAWDQAQNRATLMNTALEIIDYNTNQDTNSEKLLKSVKEAAEIHKKMQREIKKHNKAKPKDIIEGVNLK